MQTRPYQKQDLLGENTVKGAKVKTIFQGLHMTCVISTLVYNLKFCIKLNTQFNTAC
jgi:hypothetical protein